MATKTKKPPAKKKPKPKANEGPTWRRMTLAEAFDDDFDLPQGVIAVLTNLGVKTCGELTDRLLENNTFGLKLIEVQALCESIETMSSDDENPVKFNESAEPEPEHVTEAVDAITGSIPAPAAKPNTDPLTPEELAAYDAETCALTREAETAAAFAESRYLDSKEQAAADKKTYEVKVLFLRKLICDRAENRGKRPAPPEPTLLDVIPKWREKRIDVLPVMRPEKCKCAEANDEEFICEVCNTEGPPECFITLDQAGIEKLGDLFDQVGPAHNPGPCFGLPADIIATIRGQIQAVIDAESPPAPATESDLYKSYPLNRWERFGLTKKDIEKLAACETKGTATGFPIHTMGDLQRFVTPNPNSPGYVQSVKDIKGIGDAGNDRISETEMQFWGWWRAGGEAEFAAEMEAKNSPTGTPVAAESEAS